jgi:flagellar hook-associated protein 1 FlgK
VSEDNTGAYTVQTSGAVLVNGKSSNDIAVSKSKDLDYGYQVDNIVVAGTNQELNFGSGSLKAKLDSRDSTETGAKGYLNKLSSISQFFLQDFTEVHRSGYGTDNTTGNNFFGNTTAQYVDPATGAINTSDPYTWTSGTAHSPTKGDWIRALTVNSQLTGTASGVDKIASKTLATVTQSRPAGGALTFGGAYTGATNTAYTFRIDSVSGGDVATASYSTNGGTTYTAATINTTTKPPTATLNNGLTVQIATNASNTALDTYSFTPIQNNGAGDNAVLLYNRLTADTSTTANTLSNSSFQSYYTTMIGTLGIQSQDAQRQAANQKVVVDNIDSMRQSTSGVSTDQEMTDMIMFQKGYNAAARILTTMDSMLDTLINSTGMVGR